MKKLVVAVVLVATVLTGCKEEKKAATDAAKSVQTEAGKAADATKDAVTKGADAATDAVAKGADAATDAVAKGADAAKDALTKGADAVEAKAKEVAGTVESALAGVTIPKFKDEKVNAFLQDYSKHAKDFIANKGNALKKAKLVAKSAEYVKKGKEMLSGLDAESATKFKSVLSAIQSKIK